MKKYSILAVILVLTASVLAGCRRPMAEPTTVPTTHATTVPTTVPATVAPTENTRATEHATENTTAHTDGTEGTHVTVEPTGEAGARSRRVS